MLAGFFQFAVEFAAPRRNVERVRRALRQEHFDLIVLPELFNTGYLLGSRERGCVLAESVPGGETTQALTELAAEHHGTIVASICERDGKHLYNTRPS